MHARKRVLAWFTALVCAAGAPFPGGESAVAASGKGQVLELIDRYRKATWRWQRLMRVDRTKTRYLERVRGERFRVRAVRVWRERARRAYRRAYNPPRNSAWRCIHRHEGPWDANTGNGYYGGLQMDLTFQRMYGRYLLRREGRAHRWLPIEQIWIAERAYRSGRGFHPWPNAARRCGLL